MVWMRGWGVGALLALGLFVTCAAPAEADKFTAPPGCSNWTVPTGVSSIGIVAVGGAGAQGGGQGGVGDGVSETVAVAHGQVLDLCVGVGGGPGGSTGTHAGGAGGGASGLSLASNFSAPVLVAAGGGGGGGSNGLTGGTGFAANASGGSGGGSATTANGPGAGTAGANGNAGGGGGGGGYQGGSGGGSGTLSGQGGHGGTDYCPTGCQIAKGAGTTASSAEVTLSYAVAGAPTTSIGAPANGAVYPQGAVVTSSFICSEGAGGPGISSCTDQKGQPSGARIDTSSAGRHTYTVTAASGDGLSSSSTVTYTVAAPPQVWLPLPSNGAVYTVGQVVHSYFECGDGAGGPGLKSCADQNGQPPGAAIDTSTPGAHSFTVTAVSQDGLTSSVRVVYQVVQGPTVSNVQVLRGGVVALRVTVYGAGAVDAVNSASFRSFALRARAADGILPPVGNFVFGRAHGAATGAQTLSLRATLTPAGKLLLRDHRRAAIQLLVYYTTPGGTAQLVKSQALSVSR